MSTLRPEAGILPAISSPVAQQSDFGERLRALRKDRQMTLQQASKVTGVAQSTLSKMENNQLSPTFNLNTGISWVTSGTCLTANLCKDQ